MPRLSWDWETASASSMDVDEPSDEDIRICYERISKFFGKAQTSTHTQPELLAGLLAVKNEVHQATFARAFQVCLKCSITSDCCYFPIRRLFQFIANFCTVVNNNEEEGTMCYFNADLFTHLLQVSGNPTQRIRQRACRLISTLLKSLNADKFSLGILPTDAIREAMLIRILDKCSQTRVQAVFALQTLQDPANPNCPVTARFMESVCHDPSAEVRCRLVSVLIPTKRTIPLIVERHADKVDTVRRASLVVLSRLHISDLKVVQRENVLCAALQDPSPLVKKCIANELLPWWLFNNKGDYFRFLGCLDVHKTGLNNVCKEALNVLFRQAKIEDLVAVANKVLIDKLLPVDQLTEALGPQMLVFWRCLVEFFRDVGLEDDLDAILPNLTPFCGYMRQVLLGDRLPENKGDLHTWNFNVSQLFLIVEGYDFGDEMGRGKLRRLVIQLLAANKITSVTAQLVRLMEKIEPDIPARLSVLSELVFELHNPLASDQQQMTESDVRSLKTEKNKIRNQLQALSTNHNNALKNKHFTSAMLLNDQLNAAQERLRAINMRLAASMEDTVVQRKSLVVETLTRCLDIIFESMQDPKVKSLTRPLRKLMVDFVDPVFEKQDLPKPLRLLCLRCYGAFCLLDKKVTRKKIWNVFMSSLSVDEGTACAVVSLQAITDFLMCYGLPAFDMEDDMDERAAYCEENPEAELYNPILEAMLDTLQNKEAPSMVAVAANGFCKLLYYGHLHSYRVLSALILLWFHHSETKTQPKLVLEFEDFFPRYLSKRSDGLELMVKCIDPLVKEMLVTKKHEFINQVLLRMINLTLPGINPGYKKNVHLEMAEQMCEMIIDEPEHERAPYFARALSRLKLVWASRETLKDLRTKALDVEQLFAYDRRAKNFVTKFIANIIAAEAVLPVDISDESDSDESVACVKRVDYVEEMEVDD